MLDDCKGEKFDELLAGFSTAVLRKLVAVSASDMLWNPAMKISTASSISVVEYQSILPLILAHQVSLSAAGGRHARAHDTYDQFSRLLDDKKVELAERASFEAGQANDQPEADTETLAREIHANWLGGEEWASALLDGGAQSTTDSFLELPFSHAWARAKESSIDGLGVGLNQDLVIDLEARVMRLRSRLRRWREFNDTLRKERHEGGNLAGTDSQESRLLFRDHQALTVASISKAVRQPADRGRALKDTDQSFISTVNEAIAHANGKARVKARRETPESTKASPLPTSTTPIDNDEPMPLSSPDEEPPVHISEALSPQITLSHHEENTRSSPPVVHLSPDQSSEADSGPDPEPFKTTTSTSNYTLAERTRKSMSLIPPLPSHEVPTQPRSRRGPRPSFPVSQFETPRKTSAKSAHGRSGASTPQDKLFEEDVEYASVFKSRPRVAHSPVSSPAVHFSPSLEDEEFELDYDEAEFGGVDSPMPASRSRR